MQESFLPARSIRRVGLNVRLSRIDEHHIRALELSAHFRLTAAYDAHYLALAEAHDCEVPGLPTNGFRIRSNENSSGCGWIGESAR